MNHTGETIIIYGGSFDPPHQGHTALLRAAIKAVNPRRVYAVPAFRSPFKETAPVSFGDRCEMLKLALRGAGIGPGEIKVSRFEGSGSRGNRHAVSPRQLGRGGNRHAVSPQQLGRGSVTYTFDTIRHFRRLHPRAKIYFLMGSDCLSGFGRWKNYRGIIKNAGLLVGARSGFPLKNPSGAPFKRLKGRFPEVSSTSLRVSLLLGEKSGNLSGPVNGYIEEKGLYFSRERRFLKALLSPARYAHSLAVARLAAELALKHGESPQKAALAGLLHDAARDFKEKRLVRYAVSKKLKIPCFKEIAVRAPVLIHSYAAARLAVDRFGVRDRAILRAIASHTLGARRMDALSKIIYVSDLAAEGGSFLPAKKTGRLARRDLDAAFRAANYVKLKYAAESGFWRPPGKFN